MYRVRYAVLFFIGLALSLRFTHMWEVALPGEADLQLSQVAVILLLTVVGLSRGALWVGPTIRALFFLVSIIIVFNVCHMAMNPAQAGPLLRGIFNASLFFAIALLLNQAIGRYWNVQKLALTVTLLGATLAFSVVAELVLLQLAPHLYTEWANFLRRDVAFAELVDGNETRMMGLMGSAEVTGLGIALTLPFVPLAGLTVRSHGWLLSLYVMAAVLTSTRRLGVILVLYVLLNATLTHQRKVRTGGMLALIFVFSILGLFGVSLMWDSSTYGLGLIHRFGFASILFNLTFRGFAVMEILEILNRTGWGWITGLGMGSGVEKLYGLEELGAAILGGDLVLAVGFGGILGLGLLIGMWVFLLRLRREMRRVGSAEFLAMNIFIVIVGLNSLIAPTLWGFFFGIRSLLSYLPILFVLLAEALVARGTAFSKPASTVRGSAVSVSTAPAPGIITDL